MTWDKTFSVLNVIAWIFLFVMFVVNKDFIAGGVLVIFELRRIGSALENK